MKKVIIATIATTFSIATQAALHDRGNGLIYDDVLDITWLQDANYAKTSGWAADNEDKFNPGSTMGVNANGKIEFNGAIEYAKNLTLKGFNKWRLPNSNFTDNIEYANAGSRTPTNQDFTKSELWHMYYVNLKNTSDRTQPLNNIYEDKNGKIEFKNLEKWTYWYGDASDYYPFMQDFDYGNIWWQSRRNAAFVWLVHDGDIAKPSEVPAPAAAWLFGSALAGLALRKRK